MAAFDCAVEETLRLGVSDTATVIHILLSGPCP